MKKQATLLFFGIAMMLMSCSDPLQKKYSDATFSKDLQEIGKTKKVDAGDAYFIGLYVMRAKLLNIKLEDKTYREILDSARFFRERKRLQKR